jgi:predicted CXXCH cytochrome family protein
MRNTQSGPTIAALSLLFLCLPSSAQKESHAWGSRSADAPQIAGAKRLGSDTCTTCHGEVAGNFRHAYHAQQGVECEDCHGAGSLHVDGGGDITKIISFSKISATAADAACLSCHARDEKVRHWASGSHAANHVPCIECHQIHVRALRTASQVLTSFDTGTRGALLAGSVSPETNVKLRPPSATNDACLKCHQTEGAQFSMPYHHPLREGKMSCVDCHDPHGGTAGNNLRTANVNQLCLGCHAQYRGPFAYQHPPVTENCMNCHTAHGSPNTNLLSVSEPALCLQCHAGHHNGASLPLPDRCTNCHGSIHGTDTATPSGGSRFIDKGPSDPVLRGDPPAGAIAHSHMPLTAAGLNPTLSGLPAYGVGAASGAMAMLSSGSVAPLAGGPMPAVNLDPTEVEGGAASSFFSLTPGAYRFVHGSGYLGRVGEYDSLEQSAGVDAVTAYVSPQDHLTLVSRANVLSGEDYSASSQLTVGQWLEAAFSVRSLVQQQDHYPFYAFPFLDVPPGTARPCTSGVTCVDTTADAISSQAVFGVTRRLGDAFARIKVPKLPVHLFVKGNWQARAGDTQFAYLDENTLPVTAAQPCGTLCHYSSQFQQVNYTTRNIAGGADVDLGPVRITWEHSFSSFNDRLIFPTAAFTGNFTPEAEGISVNMLPPFGPAPMDVAAGNYPIDIPAPNQFSSDRFSVSWTASPKLSFNGDVSYTRLRDLYTNYPQNDFETDETLTWHPLARLRVFADYHQQNSINDFTPYYSMYGNVSYHNHWEGLRLDYELPKGFSVETYYQRSGITRSNSVLWEQTSANILGLPSQIYSIDNTDLLHVVPSSTSNTAGLALRYHDRGHWSARAGNEWTGTHDPGYLTVPQSNNRTFADVWFTPTQKLAFSNDLSVIVQNAFPAIPLLRPDGNGLTGDFQRRNRFYTETANATLRLVPNWNLGLGYSYQQNNLDTYMAFQNLPGVGYFLDEPFVPYKQITQAYWADSSYTFQKLWGLYFRLTYNSSRSGMRPDVNPADAGLLGNAALISAGNFDPGGLFPSAVTNLQFAATQISEVIVPQWIGESKLYYHFPYKIEGGFIFYYGSYRDYWNPGLNGVLRTYNVYVGRSW